MIAEQQRLEQSLKRKKDWKLWGPYLSERAWGTVREDYSADGSAWEYFPFEQAHLKTYRWNEDGIGGICDRYQNLCFALSLWNENDEILKERFYGVTGNQGNHGEDVKDYYFYLDSSPTHSYLKMLYKYPQQKFPYDLLKNENLKRDKSQPEFELIDTGIFNQNKYFDVFIEYAKADSDDICVKITAVNRSDEPAKIHLLPQIWFRNDWSWTAEAAKPMIRKFACDTENLSGIVAFKQDFGEYYLFCEDNPELLFCENETNFKKLYNGKNLSEYSKDGICEYILKGDKSFVNPRHNGTKAAAHYKLELEPKEGKTIFLRLSKTPHQDFGRNFKSVCESVFQARIAETDEFYELISPETLNADSKNILRQSLGGMLWSKQYYHYIVKDWLEGDPAFPPPPPTERLTGRNHQWTHLYNDEIISMPDKWEYPWYAAWDLAFHCIPLAMVDPDFAKHQLLLLLREWYMHPNGQIPAYEWKFSDVNPPVHAWAALRVYKIEAKTTGTADRLFLERIFHKLLLNFTWWVNRKDFEGNNVFEGGFLGLDNIGVFDRSAELPMGGYLEQSDGTSWMAMYCLNMLAIAFELALEDKAYEDVASKFFEHFVRISDAMNNIGNDNTKLWNEKDGFYYDVLHLENERNIPMRIRSLVGLIPLFAVETIEDNWLDKFPDFKKRTQWFMKNRPDLVDDIACMQSEGRENRRILAIVSKEKLMSILKYMLDETEFLSDFGIRSLSKFHKQNPYILKLDGHQYEVEYEPGESLTGMFGGNSNWRGPIWFPMNYLLIEALQKFDYYYGDEFKIEFPTGSGSELNLWDISQQLSKRLCRIFEVGEQGNRPVYGETDKFTDKESWRDNILFYEYYHGENGCGLGASHQTGWTGLIAKLIQQIGEYEVRESGQHVVTEVQKTEEGQSAAKVVKK
ncbi:MAG: glucosidase [Pyrinomonadaceae bacterium]